MKNTLEKKVCEKEYKILIIEDAFIGSWRSGALNADNQHVDVTTDNLEDHLNKIKGTLESNVKYKVDLDITGSATEAIEKLSKNTYDLIITDIGLQNGIKSNLKTMNSDLQDYRNYFEWREVIPEVYEKFCAEYFSKKDDVERKWAQIKEQNLNTGNVKLEREILSYCIDWDNTQKMIEPQDNMIGTYLATIAKQKAPTFIHTSNGHYPETFSNIYVLGHASLEQLGNLAREIEQDFSESSSIEQTLKYNFDHLDEAELENRKNELENRIYFSGNVFVSSKYTMKQFSDVINSAIDSLLDIE